MSSIVDVASALETALKDMSGSISIASENVSFTPTAGTPYQEAHVMFSQPEDAEGGAQGIFREQGIFLVRLMYPIQKGKGASLTYAQLLRTAFKKGTTFTSGSTKVTINKTPEIAPGAVDGDRWAVPVRIRFYSNVS